MTQFRVSRALVQAGVSEAEQHIIFGSCMKPNKTHEETEYIRSLCCAVSERWSDALFRFVTDQSINHVYICTEYHIPRDTLFALKREFYLAWGE